MEPATTVVDPQTGTPATGLAGGAEDGVGRAAAFPEQAIMTRETPMAIAALM
jgi:hypothetical protein